MNHNSIFSKVNKFFFFILFSFSALLFFPAACDDGGEETVNADQDVKDWCEKWIHCADESSPTYEEDGDHLPYKTLNGCYEVMQWVKDHAYDVLTDPTQYYKQKCYDWTLTELGSSTAFDCSVMNGQWKPTLGACAYTVWGECADGDYYREYPQCEPE